MYSALIILSRSLHWLFIHVSCMQGEVYLLIVMYISLKHVSAWNPRKHYVDKDYDTTLHRYQHRTTSISGGPTSIVTYMYNLWCER